GLRYYPKAVVAVPFTPATDRRILLHSDASDEVGPALVQRLRDLALELGLSSIHWLFVTAEEKALLASLGHLPRTTVQYHWSNRGWSSFEDYLGAMRGKRRREIRRERRRLAESGIRVEMLSGSQLGGEEWAAIDRFYRSTAARKWGHPYLTPSFFEEIRSTFSEAVRFAVARREGQILAGALFFERGDALYGRYWGCDARHQHLHFETCFYAPIEYCIARGVQRYEAGAQGEHKIPRGFDPVPVHSAHWIAEPSLASAVEDFCRSEGAHTRRVIELLARHSPFGEPLGGLGVLRGGSGG
ncbi:MAG: GNAT family N-acetyltransferase, partial [Myxococcota bacterium]|nr:GNAT family N-acetyltransferase [Myxococcota bacterium]